jgi:drug/metabolite transporter (DMT)-like permease
MTQPEHPFALNLFKNIAAFVLFVFTILLWHGPHVPEIATVDAGRLLLSGFLGLGEADTLIFTALNVLDAGFMLIVECLYSPFVIFVFTRVVAREPVRGTSRRLRAGHWRRVVGQRNRECAILPRRDLIRGVAIGAAGIILVAGGVAIAKPALTVTPLLWSIEIRYIGGLVGVLACRPLLKGATGKAMAIPRKEWPALFGSALAAYVQMMLWLGGLKYAQASIAAVLNQTATIFTIVLASLFLHEPLTRFRIAAAMLATTGVVFITLS